MICCRIPWATISGVYFRTSICTLLIVQFAQLPFGEWSILLHSGLGFESSRWCVPMFTSKTIRFVCSFLLWHIHGDYKRLRQERLVLEIRCITLLMHFRICWEMSRSISKWINVSGSAWQKVQVSVKNNENFVGYTQIHLHFKKRWLLHSFLQTFSSISISFFLNWCKKACFCSIAFSACGWCNHKFLSKWERCVILFVHLYHSALSARDSFYYMTKHSLIYRIIWL